MENVSMEYADEAVQINAVAANTAATQQGRKRYEK